MMILNAYDIMLMIYNITLIPIIFLSILFIILTSISLFLGKDKTQYKDMEELPFISVQIPTFNDSIAERCIQYAMKMDYPKYEIIIVDDSTSLEIQSKLKRYADENPGFVKYIHRNNREGYKPGALKNAMPMTKGDIIVIFDADWIPQRDFLKKVVRPFSDPKVAIVQTRQGFYNHETNLITRFAAYLLMIYHAIVMPINNRINTVFFCGTAGAIRRKLFEEVGGWNLNSITEDADLSAKLIMKGYKTVYLEDVETPSEVPDTIESFIKQQMRWCYGNVRVFFDNWKDILFSKKLNFKQRVMMTYITLGNIVAPFVVIMTIAGFSGWFLGEPNLMSFWDIVDLVSRFAYTSGFLVMGALALWKIDKLKELKYLIISSFTVGLVLAFANTAAFFKAVFNKGLHWYCTPKVANEISIK